MEFYIMKELLQEIQVKLFLTILILSLNMKVC